MKHSVRITRPTGDQRLVKCSCGWYSWCLYPYEARGEKEGHLRRVREASEKAVSRLNGA